jgi:hypothetical protein
MKFNRNVSRFSAMAQIFEMPFETQKSSDVSAIQRPHPIPNSASGLTLNERSTFSISSEKPLSPQDSRFETEMFKLRLCLWRIECLIWISQIRPSLLKKRSDMSQAGIPFDCRSLDATRDA